MDHSVRLSAVSFSRSCSSNSPCPMRRHDRAGDPRKAPGRVAAGVDMVHHHRVRPMSTDQASIHFGLAITGELFFWIRGIVSDRADRGSRLAWRYVAHPLGDTNATETTMGSCRLRTWVDPARSQGIRQLCYARIAGLLGLV